MITVTDDAIAQMNSILERNGDAAVRYELKGGGCGGIIAEWKTEPHYEPEQGEMTWPLANGIFVMDEYTKDFIDGEEFVVFREQRSPGCPQKTSFRRTLFGPCHSIFETTRSRLILHKCAGACLRSHY